MCASWAAVGECEANPVYMTGAGRHRGHCEASCGVCRPDRAWKGDARTAADLRAAAAAAGAALRAAACVAAKACLTGGGGTTPGGGGAVPFVEREPDVTPGALLAKLPGKCAACLCGAVHCGAFVCISALCAV